MLKLYFPKDEAYDEVKNEFIYLPERTVMFEHSLISISKWESKWHKSFFSSKDKTNEEALDYIRCMAVTPNVPEDVFYRLTQEQMEEINRYIHDPATATTFSKADEQRGGLNRKYTSEEIYYAMFANNIPMECQKWHINKLLAQIKVCNIRNNPNKKKVPQNEHLSRASRVNAERRAKLNSKG